MTETAQSPQLGIESVVNRAEQIILPENTFPWIEGQPVLSTAHIELETGESFLYASAVGLHGGVEKLASKVPREQSEKAELGLFKAIPELLKHDGQKPPNVDYVPAKFVDASAIDIFKIAKRGHNAARLYFTIIEQEGKRPLVVKLGIANHSEQIALQAIMSKKKRGQNREG